MTTPAIKALTLYKHGVGYFYREGPLVDNRLELLVKREAMNDILKSLFITTGGIGQVLGVEYETPQTEKARLESGTIQLQNGRAFRDLLAALGGRPVTCQLKDDRTISGVVIGLDEPVHSAKIGRTMVTIFIEAASTTVTLAIKEIQALTIDDDTARRDLGYFLDQLNQMATHSTVTIRFSDQTVRAAVAYVAPAPTWRISYRLAAELVDNQDQGNALFQGWAIFDNILEEPLTDISLSLVTGMPISFTYGLYHPVVPQRPHFVDQDRTIDEEIAFDSGAIFEEQMAGYSPASASMAAPPRARFQTEADRSVIEEGESSVQIQTEGADLGELYEYQIQTPVSVGRGQSAMVPIFQSKLAVQKKLVFNDLKYKSHPVAVYEIKNQTGGPLERGPVTVIENGDYLGDALVNYSTANAQVLIPFAVELGIQIKRSIQHARQKERISLRKAFLVYEEWDIRTSTYLIHNKLDRDAKITIEHPRQTHYNLITTPSLVEETAENWRFSVPVGPLSTNRFEVTERRLVIRKQALTKLSWREAQTAFQDSLLDERSKQRLRSLLEILEPLEKREAELAHNSAQRAEIFDTQKQIQANMAALGIEGKEGALRLRYVETLEKTEDQLLALADEAKGLEERIETLKNLLATQLQAWIEKF